MDFAKILRAFGGTLIVLSVAMLAPAAIARGAEQGAYVLSAGLALFAGGSLRILSPARLSPAGFREAIALVLCWWIVAPVFGGLPFVFRGMGLADGWFEAVSALTTTGGWLNDEAARASAAGMFWRAELEWLGGLASLASAAALFIRPHFTGVDTMPPPFAFGEYGSPLRALRQALATFAPIYAVITFACFALLAATGVAPIEAAVLAMSTLASGGFTPHEGGLAAYPSFVPGLLLPFVVASGANFILIARVMRPARESGVKDGETLALIILIFVLGGAYWLSTGGGSLARLPSEIFNAASMISTNGATIGQAPLVIALVTAIIGGAAVSTAGGLKLLRWLIVFRRAGEELWKLAEPSGVRPRSGSADELGVWIHFVAFALAAGGLLLLVAVYGHSFETAAAASVAALANTGPLLALAHGDGNYAQLEPTLRMALGGAMILGRLEAVAALAVINHAFWRS